MANQCRRPHRGGRLGETLQTVSIKSHFDGWLASKGTRKAEATWKRYGMAVDGNLFDTGKPL